MIVILYRSNRNQMGNKSGNGNGTSMKNVYEHISSVSALSATLFFSHSLSLSLSHFASYSVLFLVFYTLTVNRNNLEKFTKETTIEFARRMHFKRKIRDSYYNICRYCCFRDIRFSQMF